MQSLKSLVKSFKTLNTLSRLSLKQNTTASFHSSSFNDETFQNSSFQRFSLLFSQDSFSNDCNQVSHTTERKSYAINSCEKLTNYSKLNKNSSSRFDDNKYLWSDVSRRNIFKLSISHENIVKIIKTYMLTYMINEIDENLSTTWSKRRKMWFKNVMRYSWIIMTIRIRKHEKIRDHYY